MRDPVQLFIATFTGVGAMAAAGLAQGPTDMPKPTPEQLAWQEDEMAMFLHFGVNTFTNREWGEGTEDPAVFNPTELDARQWARVAKEAGFRLLILTAKHHDGFCLWPSAHTEHSVKNSPWREGEGDVVREVAEACRAEGLKFGFYLSPWDRHEPTYGDSPAYNEHFRNQLRELLTGYGEVTEVWFDGACGEGPNGKVQQYDWESYYALVRELQPHALIAICGPDIRWVGNEDGVARETEWSVQERDGRRVWYPAECDVSIRPGWFWHADQDAQVKPLDHLLDIYFKSVGRNSVLLLNVPPNDNGLLADPDVARLRELRAALDEAFASDLARGAQATSAASAEGAPPEGAVDGDPETYWAGAGPAESTLEIDLGQQREFSVSSIQEYIAEGQRVTGYVLQAWDGRTWSDVVRGITIGHQKLDRFPMVSARRLRLTVSTEGAPPLIRAVELYHAPNLAP